MIMKQLKTYFWLALLTIFLVASQVSVLLAQEEELVEESEAVFGSGLFVLVIGLGAVAAVAFFAMATDDSEQPTEAE